MKTYDIKIKVIYEHEIKKITITGKKTKKVINKYENNYHLFSTKELNRKKLRIKAVQNLIDWISNNHNNTTILSILAIEIDKRPLQAYTYFIKQVYTIKENGETWVDLPKLEEVNLSQYKKEKGE
jgi:hypothetical protein